jgi:hypothetical protein
LFKSEWRRLANAGNRSSELIDQRFTVECGPIEWVLPDLLRMADDLSDGPRYRLEAAVRRLLSEQHFVEGCGDLATSHSHDQFIEHFVRVTLIVLDHIRADERYPYGQAVTPEMFG